MRLTILGGAGAWPGAGQACSGYLVEHAGFRLVVDPGYAVLPRLLRTLTADDVDAVVVSHGHADHCADLNPLLRARTFRDEPAARPLMVHALAGALDVVLALDRPGALDESFRLLTFDAGVTIEVGPFAIQTVGLPHSRPNVGLRIRGGDAVLAYTGDAGPDPARRALARDADVYLAEASYVETVPDDSAATLSSAAAVGREADEYSVGTLVLTHLLPGVDPRQAREAARRAYRGPIRVARGGVAMEVGSRSA